MLKILYLYNSAETYTNTVFEHIASFSNYSRHRSFFCHSDATTEFNEDLSCFDAVAIHYSVRLAFNFISPSTVKAVTEFSGIKILFIQDEYDHTHRAWHWIKTLGIHLVFTVVPEVGVERVYPACEFPGTRFISTLTGYVPGDLNLNPAVNPPSQRSLIVGYRGRPLPIRYGRLGMEKIRIGELVKNYCDAHYIKNDIAWSEETRIYGPRWNDFILSCRSMLGSESGSNVFDWDGTLAKRIAEYRRKNPNARNDEIYDEVVRAEEIEGLMNQISPRVFEAIAAKTVLVLFEGNYSGVVKAGEHFVSLKKDGSNLAEVIRLLQDGAYVDAMAERAYREIIASGKYSYQSFVSQVDEEIELAHRALGQMIRGAEAVERYLDQLTPITKYPTRTSLHPSWRLAVRYWGKLPDSVRGFLKPPLKWLFGRA
jgi:hypothetical protein